LIHGRTPVLYGCWETEWRPELSATSCISGNFARNNYF
jgi:hypothetical protein